VARILIVDDEPSVVMLMRLVLEKAGHEALEAFNGKEALKVLGVEPADPAAPIPDLILLDVMMPVVDGYTVALTLKDHPRVGKVPIVVVTAKGDMRRLFESLPAVAGFFGKPFDPSLLREAVEKIIAARR
jgi:CheY-like chemotaxis protein